MLVCLDPGHGGADWGAIGFSLKEKEVCLELAYRIRRKLHGYNGISVTMTRLIDTSVSNQERICWANNQKADLFISLHTLASMDPKASGFATYVSVFAGTETRQLQCWLHNRLVRFLRDYQVCDLGKRNDTESPSGPIYEWRQLNMPALAIASLHITHSRENRLLANAQFLDAYASTIAEGIASIYQQSKQNTRVYVK